MRRKLLIVLLLALPSCTAAPVAGTKPDYLVFFTEHSAALDATATQVIARAAAEAKAAPDAPVTIYGYTDSAGSAQADVILSQQRAQGVADSLIADGVAPSRIARHGVGQTHEDPGVASRRVEITIGG